MREGGWRNGYPVWPENGVVSPGARVKSYELSDMSTPEKKTCVLWESNKSSELLSNVSGTYTLFINSYKP